MNRRQRFVVTYLATAVLGSISVFFGAPLLRGAISAERFDRMSLACRSDSPLSGVFMAMIGPRPGPARRGIAYQPPPPPQPSVSRADPVRAAEIPRAESGLLIGHGPSIPEQAPAVNNTVPPPPVSDYSAMWAIVTNDTAAVYDGNGDLAQELGSGSLIEVAAVRTNQSERLAICRYDTKPRDMGIALVRTRDLALRKGSLESANADLVSLLVRQTRLETEIRALRAASAGDLAKQNPNTEAYSSARSACLAFNENAKSLRTQANSTQGGARMEIMDKLRAMKDEEARLRRDYETAKRAFDKWNEEHAVDAKDTEQMQSLRQELADVRKRIDRMDAN